MSAVSKNVMPCSSAASTTARVPSRSTRRPKLLQPSPIAGTSSPESPSGRFGSGVMLGSIPELQPPVAGLEHGEQREGDQAGRGEAQQHWSQGLMVQPCKRPVDANRAAGAVIDRGAKQEVADE